MADSNSRVKIAELLEIHDIDDDDLMIVEDEEDTKQSTVKTFKQALSGDFFDPSRYRFYSSMYMDDMIKTLNIAIKSKASSSEIQKLADRVEQIVTNNPDGTKDQELIDARGSQSSLSGRFDYERFLSDGMYMKKKLTTVSGDYIDLPVGKGPITVEVLPKDYVEDSTPGTLNIYSKNRLNISDFIRANLATEKLENDYLKITFLTDISNNCNMSFNQLDKCNAGIYYLIGEFQPEDNLVINSCKVVVGYTDSTIDTFDYQLENVFSFEAKKTFNKLNLLFDVSSTSGENPVLTVRLMLSSTILDEYVPYYSDSRAVSQYDTIELDNDGYILSHTVPNSTLQVKYYDDSVNIDSIMEEIETLKSEMNDHIDHCGLITDRGTYMFFNNYDAANSDFTVEDSTEEFYRNGVPSKKITIKNDAAANPSIKQIIPKDLRSSIEYVSLFFYFDRTAFSYLTDSTGLCIHVSSDTPEVAITNYYTYRILKYEMVQGWNCIKRKLSEFEVHGSPDINNLQTVTIELERNANLNGSSFYLNSIAFNQKMKPTVMICFDGTHDTSIDYLYPYLTSRKIPCTIVMNSSRTLTAAAEDYLIGLRLVHNWDLGVLGCNPNKEILIEDDNYRNQYVALKASRQWLTDRMFDHPISYTAPYGNLRPITVPILKDLGYKIARTESNAYISNFSKYDFAIPCQLVANTNKYDEIKTRIDYAIDNNVALCLYTTDVTEYGNEISATQVLFESIINYIIERRDTGDLQVLTMKDFYEKCVNED